MSFLTSIGSGEGIYQMVFDHSPFGMVIIDSEGKLLKTNKAFQNFLGYSANELEKLTYSEITPPSDHATDSINFKKLGNNSIENYYSKKQYFHKNGKKLWGDQSATSLGLGSDQRQLFLNIIKDISKERDQQNKIQKLIDDLRFLSQKISALHCIAEFGYFTIDLVNEKWICSPEFNHIFGYDKSNSPENLEQFLAMIHPEDLPVVKQNIDDNLSKGEPSKMDYRCIHQKTSAIIYVSSYFTVEFYNNKPIKLFGVFHNISKTEILNEKLKEANKKLEEFAYVVSHDLKEPVRGVIGMMGLLQKKADSKLNSVEREYVQLAVNNSRRMNRMIEDLLEYSRTGRINEQYENVSLIEIIKEAIEATKEPIEMSQAKLYIPDHDIIIKGFPNLLSRLLQNLISNAVKYKSDVPPEITISATEHTDWYEILVQDNGIGIDPSHHEKIFRLFNRVNRKNDENSNGMGLALCKNIATLHNGSIKVESELGKGSVFIVNLSKNIEDTILN